MGIHEKINIYVPPKVGAMLERDGAYYQYYRCSKEQVYLYFRKFDPDIVEIIAPESLRERMRRFYESGVEAYSGHVPQSANER